MKIVNYKALALGAILGLAAALVPSCGGKTACGPSNCDGCCDSSNNCVKLASIGNTACGKSGLTCIDCSMKAATPSCNTSTGICTAGGTGGGAGGGAGGGSAGGGTGVGGGGGGGATCAGCCSGSSVPGSGGCAMGTCLINGNTATNCGSNGVTCQNCQVMNMNCSATAPHVCTGGTGGGSGDGGITGLIGSACNTNADCNHETGTTPGATGTGFFCKKTQLVGGATYPGGYCTHRCTSDNDCDPSPTNPKSFCSWYYGLGQTGEADNYCIAKCTTQADCRMGYNCVDFSGNQTVLGCLLAAKDGGVFDEFDAGPSAHPLVMGNACTADMDCQPPDLGACIPDMFDGGPSGWPGGQCTADCTMNPSNAFCGTGAVCAPEGADLGDGLGIFVDWICRGKCWVLPDGGQGLYDGGTPAYSCRSGYHCNEVFTDHSGGCQANCDNPGNPGCNTAGGFACDPSTHSCK